MRKEGIDGRGRVLMRKVGFGRESLGINKRGQV